MDRTHNHITLSGRSVHLVVLAGPSGNLHDTFRIAGLIDPTIVVQSGERVSIEVVNADSEAAQGLVIAAAGSAHSRMPMISATPSFTGSALWFLGNPTSAGMHAGTLTFTATKSGTFSTSARFRDMPGRAWSARSWWLDSLPFGSSSSSSSFHFRSD